VSLSTFELDPLDREAIDAMERLLPGDAFPLLICGDIPKGPATALQIVKGGEVTPFSYRYDVVAQYTEPGESPQVPAGDFAAVCVVQRKSKARTLAILEAMRAAFPDTQLILLGHNKRGIKSMPKRLRERWAEVKKMGDASHCTAYVLSGWTADERAEETKAGGFDYDGQHWHAKPGVFGVKGLDDGTERLLDLLPPANEHAALLDVGCGTGVLGLRDLIAAEGSQLVGVDADWFAVTTARENAEALGVSDRATFEWGDIFPREHQLFDRIVSNPPFHSGSRTSYTVAAHLIEKAPRWLAAGGELWLVANSFLPYPDYLDASFDHWTREAEDDRFTIYRAVKGGAE
jgi:16S rRNA (guanine1207-N2)-methyltransferase